MKKTINDQEIKFPFTMTTNFRVEQEANYNKTFTIISAATDIKTGKTYVLLENNAVGEEWTMVIKLPKNIWWLYNDNGTTPEKSRCFIPCSFVIVENAWNDLGIELEDADVIDDKSELIFWTSEEINDIK